MTKVGFVHTPMTHYLKVLLTMITIIPGIVAVLTMLDKQADTALAMVALNLINICIATVLALFAARAFEYPEVNQ